MKFSMTLGIVIFSVSSYAAEFAVDTAAPKLGAAESSRGAVIMGEPRITATGFVFTPSVLSSGGEEFHEHYPSRLIWGDVVKDHGKLKLMTHDNAEKYCECNTEDAKRRLGCNSEPGRFHLPTCAEYNQLASHLGYGTTKGYNPYMADGKSEIIPGLRDWFWATSDDVDCGTYPLFIGLTGNIEDRPNDGLASVAAYASTHGIMSLMKSKQRFGVLLGVLKILRD